MWASQGLVQHVNADPLLVHQLEGVRGRALTGRQAGMGIVPRG